MPFSFMPINATCNRAMLLGALLILASCEEQTGIQRDYVSNRNECQGFAESNIGRFMDESSDNDIRARNAKLVTLFSDCMFEMGWTVATPEREDDPENQDKQVAKKDDLRDLNDVRAGAARAPAAATQQPAAPQAQQPAMQPQPPVVPQTAQPSSTLMDANRRAPSAQPVQ